MEPVSPSLVPVRGFTLVEMLVVLAIITIITAITLTGQSTFNRSLLLTDTAYTLALSLREMQTLGLSSRAFGGVQNVGYGGRFTASPGTSYILFADTNRSSPTPLANCPAGVVGALDAKPGNCVYTASDGLFQTYELTRGFRVTRICGTTPGVGGNRYCSDTSGLTALDVVFVRSNTTDAVITGQRAGSEAYAKAEIYVTSPDGEVSRAICVSQVGQISVAYSACP